MLATSLSLMIGKFFRKIEIYSCWLRYEEDSKYAFILFVVLLEVGDYGLFSNILCKNLNAFNNFEIQF
jgi:hypothetical protein